MSFAPLVTYTLGSLEQSSQMSFHVPHGMSMPSSSSAPHGRGMYPHYPDYNSDDSSAYSPYSVTGEESGSDYSNGNMFVSNEHHMSMHGSMPSPSALYCSTGADLSSSYSEGAPPSPNGQHDILPIFPAAGSRPENWVHSFRVAGKSMFKCTWPQCPRGLFRQAEKALDHVCGHIQVKQYRCTCGKIFVSSSTAKRHCAMQSKVYPCQFCPKKFARKDYLKVHETRCASTHHLNRT